MFTGIIENLGEVTAIEPRTDGVARLAVFTTLDLTALGLGASVAVDGVCLTITSKTPVKQKRRAGTLFTADLGPETLAITTLQALKVGQRVHLERALRLGDSLGGHMVSGHVDGQGVVKKSQAVGQAHELVVQLPAALAKAVIPKGSVAINGVSLTINWVKGRQFQVMLIPHTLAMTTLGELCPHDRVNIETDLMAKHVIRVTSLYLESRDTPQPSPTRAKRRTNRA
ncbi:MAG: riboflavin synthase [Deltaproteobacteria bacterium]|nr:riboflavin synthase [Deltaproteobacteria bacterium]